ncbi:hypothetical protein Misp01_73010 [Microtetraspora sp. NBRC 13810]|uniref:hypothetical protein n=1 Tax=Microtetraspora sp. NBRC 13810 TaxID=3030990 RepID=UPI0024A30ABC|nr:hypothetical protein [Microtetraspora sp. NBRC 13810]GLW12173.1 hypothetical protein Misp01_73010 [Microtetraspora sp. NBRC 13810]
MSLLLLNTVLNQDSFEADRLRDENKRIQLQQDQVRQLNSENDTPAAIAEGAEALNQRRDWDSVNRIPSEGRATGAGDAVRGGAEDRDR